ncbi:MAG: N-acetylmuramoyl-L-alanine amidase [Chloroflexota bacterium]
MLRHALLRLAVPVTIAAVLVASIPALSIAGRSPVKVIAREVAADSALASSVVALPIAASHVAVHWRGRRDLIVHVAFSPDGQSFGPARDVGRDETGEARGDGETYGAIQDAAGAKFVRLTADRPLGQVRVLALDAGEGATATSLGGTVAAAAAEPAVISRAGWGADESLRFDAQGNELWTPAFYPVQKLIVHHTATANSDPDPAATVRSIYYYHAVTQGWGDIGYNFLIDEAGRVYEGRYSRPYAAGETPTGADTAGRGVTAAHVAGYNSGTVGVSLLGTLTSRDATGAARDALERILAWEADRNGIDPNGTSLYTNPVNGTQKTFPNIAGHRDLAATECPGGTFYATFPSLRNAVAARLGASPPPPATVPGPPTATATPSGKGKGIQVSWTTPSNGGSPITGYRLYRSTTGPPVLLAQLAGTTTSYRDSAAKRGVTYGYTVTAVNSVGEGPSSNSAVATAR